MPAVTKLKTFLLVVALAGLVLAGGSLPHTHVAGTPGVWNLDHDASLMAAFGLGAALPDGPPAVALVLVVTLALARAAARLAAAPCCLADSRAPPSR